MTVSSLRKAGVQIKDQGNVYLMKGAQKYAPAESSIVEGDWSNAAFFLCMGALSRKGITVSGLDPDSLQGDRQIIDILARMGAQISIFGDAITVRRDKLNALTLDVSQIPDLVPAVSALMALSDGTSRITNARRLRLKESDRLKTTCAFLRAIGADAAPDGDGIVIKGNSMLAGGKADSFGDHRIAMALTLAAGGCENPVIINGAEAVSKSFPDCFKRFDYLEEEK
jgi:3-phosphoshikimate 1-carboxyvinyltransferase